MRFRTKLVVALLIGFADPATAQIVVEDVAKWSEKECRWLHSQVLAECENQQTCSASREKLDLSMSSQRGMYALEPVISARLYHEFYGICFQACRDKTRPSYVEFQRSFCSRVMRRK